jgi:hypothetical protein
MVVVIVETQSVMPAKAGIQYAAAFMEYTGIMRLLDHPLSRVMTVESVADDRG